MDKLTLDFENNKIIFDTSNQKGEISCPELSDRKQQILSAIGLTTVDIQPAVNAFQNYISGQISETELEAILNDFLADEQEGS